jgi:acetyl esterase/lipase
MPSSPIEEQTGEVNTSDLTRHAASEESGILSIAPSIHWRIAYFISVWSFKAAISFALGTYRLFIRKDPTLLQAEIKVYPVRPDLKNRVFRPRGLSNEKCPLFLDLHGGGWAVADPETDDEFCSFMAQKFNMIVISVEYHNHQPTNFHMPSTTSLISPMLYLMTRH